MTACSNFLSPGLSFIWGIDTITYSPCYAGLLDPFLISSLFPTRFIIFLLLSQMLLVITWIADSTFSLVRMNLPLNKALSNISVLSRSSSHKTRIR